MRVQIQLRIVTDDDTVLSEDVIACFDKGDDQLEEIGLSLDQAKTMLARAKDAAAFWSALRSAPVPWSAHAFTAAPASRQPARPSAR